MSYGPIELFVIGFEGNRFNGEVAPALVDLVDRGIVRIIDLLFVTKDEAGEVVGLELAELDDELRTAFDALAGATSGLMSDEDIEDVGDSLDPSSSVLVLVVEHLWAATLAEAIQASGGELIRSNHIPHDAVEAVIGARPEGVI
jgi:uncharacterized membrane protein